MRPFHAFHQGGIRLPRSRSRQQIWSIADAVLTAIRLRAIEGGDEKNPSVFQGQNRFGSFQIVASCACAALMLKQAFAVGCEFNFR